MYIYIYIQQRVRRWLFAYIIEDVSHACLRSVIKTCDAGCVAGGGAVLLEGSSHVEPEIGDPSAQAW